MKDNGLTVTLSYFEGMKYLGQLGCIPQGYDVKVIDHTVTSLDSPISIIVPYNDWKTHDLSLPKEALSMLHIKMPKEQACAIALKECVKLHESGQIALPHAPADASPKVVEEFEEISTSITSTLQLLHDKEIIVEKERFRDQIGFFLHNVDLSGINYPHKGSSYLYTLRHGRSL